MTQIYNELQRIIDWNIRAENFAGDEEIGSVVEVAQRNLIKEELQELKDAFNSGNRDKTIDALTDLAVVITGYFHRVCNRGVPSFYKEWKELFKKGITWSPLNNVDVSTAIKDCVFAIEEDLFRVGTDINAIKPTLFLRPLYLSLLSIYTMGHNPAKVLKIVNDSNFSKFVDVTDDDEVWSTIKSYEKDDRYTDVRVNESGVVLGTVVATGSKKVLKGAKYTPPDWSLLNEDVCQKAD
jgi:hypothetical protein